MHRTWLALVALLFAPGCQKSGPAPATPEQSAADGTVVETLAKRVDDIDKRLARIEALLAQAMGGGSEEPDPSVVYSVPIDGDPFVGPADAKITIVKGFEFACGFCYRVRPTLAKIRATYGADVKIVYKYFVVHDQAVGPGLAACAAHKQGKFAEMKDLIWDKGFAEEEIGHERMRALASEAGLDMSRFAEDVASTACMDWLKNGYQTLSGLGVRGTPAFYVNGRFISGAQPFEVFKQVIDEELAKANQAIANGAAAASYYQDQVVAKGRKEL